MFTKYQAVFRSRWRALLWSAGVLLTAYCTVPKEEGEEDPAVALAGIVAGSGSDKPATHAHVNPWAVDKSEPDQHQPPR